MAFDETSAVWIDPAGVCPEAGGTNCHGYLGIDPNNRKRIDCATFSCPAELSSAAVAKTIEQPNL